MSSPPYWGLRDYGVEATVWGGEAECAHEWGDELLDRSRRSPGTQNGSLTGDGRYQAEACRFEIRSNFCVRCGAWRGVFGLEPTYQLYVAHAVEIGRAVRRVLRRDGTFWLNLGDSYATGAGAVGEHPGGGEQGARWRHGGTEKTNNGHRTVDWGSRSRAWEGRPEPGATSTAGYGRSARRGGTSSERPAMGKQAYLGESIGIGPTTQPNRMPQPGLKPKDLCGIPWRVALALQDDGWWLRQDVIWAKPNPMPESITDRCTKAHEYLFMLSRDERYYFDAVAIAEPAAFPDGPNSPESIKSPYGQGFTRRGRAAGNKRHKGVEARESGAEEHQTKAGLLEMAGTAYPTRNKRSVWTVATSPFPEAHFATFPPDLIEPCVRAGTSERGCCPTCAAPWQRVTARTLMPTDCAAKTFVVDDRDVDADDNDQGSNRQKDGHQPGFANAVDTLGWYPGCDCAGAPPLPDYPERPGRARFEVDFGAFLKKDHDAAVAAWRRACAPVTEARRKLCAEIAKLPTKPAVVCDPFGGAGTTALVADRFGRDAVIVELKPEYADMAERRIRRDAGMFADVAAE